MTVGFAVLVVFAAVYGLQKFLQPPPQMAMTERHFEDGAVADIHDPQLDALRADLESDPQSIEKLKILAGALGDKLRNDPKAPPTVVFEAIDVLGKILAIAPNDPGALVMMADVSFDQRAFTKAQDFYERYLKIEPDNLGARARYASTLTFLGQYDKSIQELNTVLKVDPKNFPAMAYLSITYAQQGDVSKAKQYGKSALNLAPSDEAKARFSAFMGTLNESGKTTAESAPRGTLAAQSTEVVGGQSGLLGFISSVRANPVAGPKFVRYDDSKAGVVRLVFREFPMGQMPPFAKDKFFNTLRQAAAAAKLDGVGAVVFVDDATGGEMATLSLK
jgi:cytochrome c-type biogenesis protein CcmH/NrfG